MALLPEPPPLAPSADLQAFAQPHEPLHRQLQPLLAFSINRLLASPVTLMLIAACVLLDALSRRWGPGHWRELALWHMGEGQWTAVLEGDVHRVLAATFLHRNAKHLVGNVISLLVTGLLLEPALGARRIILLYVVSCLAGALCYLPEGRDLQVVGASGGITGLQFALLGFRMRLRRPFPLPLGKRAYAVVQFCALVIGGGMPFAGLARSRGVLFFAILFGVSAEVLPPRNVAHLGGALAGMLLSYTLVIRPRHMRGAEPPGLSFLSLLAGLASAAASSSIGIAIGAGQPWRIKDEPALAAVRLENTSFAVDVPQLAGRPPKITSSDALHFFDYGSLTHSPVSLTIMVSKETFPGFAAENAASAEEYVAVRRRLGAKEELLDSELRRTMRSTQVAGVPAVRVDSERDAFRITSIGLIMGGFTVQVSGYREHWAAQQNPPVWDGIEERVAASLRIVGK